MEYDTEIHEYSVSLGHTHLYPLYIKLESRIAVDSRPASQMLYYFQYYS